MTNPGDLPDGNLTSGPSRQARITTAPGMKTKVDISVLYHLQTPMDAIKGSTAIALGRTPTPGPAETRRLFQAISRQADLLNHLVDNMIDRAETGAKEQRDDGEPEPFVLEELTINYAERRVTVAGCPVMLTATEYRLLQELSNNAGRVLTQERLLRRVWGFEYSDNPKLLQAFVKSLRRKLGDDARSPIYIFTEPRVGYRMAKP